MYPLLILSLLTVCSLASPYSAEDWPDDDFAAFQLFQSRFEKLYATADEFNYRFNIFKENRITAKLADKSDPHASYGITMFSDLTHEEFHKRYLTLRPHTANYKPTVQPTPFNPDGPTFDSHAHYDTNKKVPPMWDWRSSMGMSMVTPVKNQGSCGSCWSFAACAAAESFLMIHPRGNDPIPDADPNPIPDIDVNSLSTQALVDCVKDTCHGCNGGLPSLAFEKFVKMGWHHPAYLQYPYKGVDNLPCMVKSKPGLAKKYKGYTLVNPNFNWTQFDTSGISAEDYCKAIYFNSPIATALDATGLQFYTGGVISTAAMCSWRVNHAVTAVGYGIMSGAEDQPNPINWNMMVAIVKNSWGEQFGEEGYFRIWLTDHIYPINPDAKSWGLCGIRRYASFANVCKQC
ncbi:hypothetical protein P9112_008816 [Eukaryota sp. TZLM1-RC]